ncbi:hypothetical protein CMEL01_12211 [Colletotrichum melonis]|uniref:Uncharacterized protein n=1 Tax=Colletotrichum melonis TaxID=1209925 RepID=A0AAI9UWB3_9PEZI|nr:hypothetical protein CMEL01_12211 [Colletotrichum melonis]
MFSNINSKNDACQILADDHFDPYPPYDSRLSVSDLDTLLGVLLAGSYASARLLFGKVRSRRRVCCTGLGANDRVVEDCTSASLPIVDETLADFPNRSLDALGCALDLNDALS